METPCLCPSEGHKHDDRKVAETSVTEFCHAKQKLGNSNMLYYKRKNPVELKRCESSGSYGLFYLINLKPQRER